MIDYNKLQYFFYQRPSSASVILRRTAPGTFRRNMTEAEEDQVMEEILFDPI